MLLSILNKLVGRQPSMFGWVAWEGVLSPIILLDECCVQNSSTGLGKVYIQYFGWQILSCRLWAKEICKFITQI